MQEDTKYEATLGYTVRDPGHISFVYMLQGIVYFAQSCNVE